MLLGVVILMMGMLLFVWFRLVLLLVVLFSVSFVVVVMIGLRNRMLVRDRVMYWFSGLWMFILLFFGG